MYATMWSWGVSICKCVNKSVLHWNHPKYPSSTQYRYRNQVYGATQEMHSYGIECYNHRTNEIKLFDDALANSFDEVQAISIKLIDKFFSLKADCSMNLNQAFQSSPINSTDDHCTATHRTHVDTLCDNFKRSIDSIWYSLIELETSTHERILDSMNRFTDTIRTIIERFNDKCNETFMRIRSACTIYFQSNIDSQNETVEQYQINIINHQLDRMCTRANKWLSQTIESYELYVLWIPQTKNPPKEIRNKQRKNNNIFIFSFFSSSELSITEIESKSWKSAILSMPNAPHFLN